VTDHRLAQRRLGLVLSFLSAISWSSAGLFTRFIPLDIWTLLFWRGLFGALFIGAYAVWQARGDLGRLARGMGWPGIGLAFVSSLSTLTLIPAFRLTTVANASVILATGPFLAAFIAWFWLGERSRRATLAAAGFATLGVAVMVGGSGGSGSRIGDALALLAIAAMSTVVVGVRRYRGIPLLSMVALANLMVMVASLPNANPGAAGPAEIFYSALFAAATMILGFVLLVMSSRLIPAVETALIGTLETPLAPLWIWLAFGEVPSGAAFLGGAVVLAAVIGHLLVENRRSASGA
jgi:drug/metabolite transporter (DMT)-like permease